MVHRTKEEEVLMNTNMFLRFTSRVGASMILTVLVFGALMAGTIFALAQHQPVPLADTPTAVHTFGEEERGVSMSGTLTPLGQGFGDRVLAKVEVWIDTTLVNPDRITFEVIDFEPYTTMTDLSRSVELFDGAALVTYTIELRCLKMECLDATGMPVFLGLKRMYVQYVYWDGHENGSDRFGYVGGSWRASAVVGRITPEALEEYVFEGNATPPEPQLGVSYKGQQLVLLMGILFIGGSILFLMNPQIKLWPQRQDPKEWIAKYNRVRVLSSKERICEALDGLKHHTKSGDVVLYRLANELRDAGHEDLAVRVQTADFGPDSDSEVFGVLIRDIEEALDARGVHHG